MFKSLLKSKKPFDLYQLYYQTIAFFIFFSKENLTFYLYKQDKSGAFKKMLHRPSYKIPSFSSFLFFPLSP